MSRKMALMTTIVGTMTAGLVACQPAVAPATPPATAITSPVATVTAPAIVTPITSPTAAPAIVTPIPSATPAPAGSMAALSQIMSSQGEQLGRASVGQVSAQQMQQAMDQVANTARQVSPIAGQGTQGTPDVRRAVTQTVDQLGSVATQLRERAPMLTPEQRKLAIQQLQVLVLDIAQIMRQIQNMAPQPGASEQQSVTGQLQQVRSTMDYMLVQYGVVTPTAGTPTR